MESIIEIINDTKFGLYKKLVSLNLIDELIDLTKFLDVSYIDIPHSQRYWHIRNGVYTIMKCDCGKPAKFNISKSKYVLCSKTCINNKNSENGKLGNTEISINKRKLTNIKKFGVDNYSKTEEFKEKSKSTNTNRFGVDNYSKTEEFKEKVINGILSVDGKHMFSTKEFKEKSKSTIIKKFGVDNPMKSSVVKEKSKKTFLETYGVDNPMKNDDIKRHRLRLSKEKFINNLPANYELLKFNGNTFHLRHIACSNDFLIDGSLYHTRKHKYKTEICTTCNPMFSNDSSFEREIVEFISSLGIVFHRNVKNMIDPYEIDIYLPNFKLAIECNGLYWHSDAHKSKNYHKIKSDMCRENGIHMVHIWEDDWLYKQDIIKSILTQFIGNNNNKIFARKCCIKKIDDTKEIKTFLENNHIQGNTSQSISYGLFYKEEFVQIMCFKKIDDKSYELCRFASKLGSNIIGGASKLFKHFTNNNDFHKIVTFSDISLFNGNVYLQMGMTDYGISKPTMWNAIKINGYWKRIHRRTARRHDGEKLSIYNSGLKKFVFEKFTI